MLVPTPETVLALPDASDWLKTALQAALTRDPMQASADADALALVLDQHAEITLAASSGEVSSLATLPQAIREAGKHLFQAINAIALSSRDPEALQRGTQAAIQQIDKANMMLASFASPSQPVGQVGITSPASNRHVVPIGAVAAAEPAGARPRYGV